MEKLNTNANTNTKLIEQHLSREREFLVVKIILAGPTRTNTNTKKLVWGEGEVYNCTN